MSELPLDGKIWLTAFWGFDPEQEGVLGFTAEADRNRFMQTISQRQLVCIYGAASEETAKADVHQLLGVLDLERIAIDSWSKSSQFAIDRNISLKRENKWRFAVPVRRAWRTSHHLDVGQVLPQSYNPQNGRYISKFGTWIADSEADWLRSSVPFRRVPVFGELNDDIAPNEPETKLIDGLKPSRAILPGFGDVVHTLVDRPHSLYLAHFSQGADLISGQKIARGDALLKIGISGNLANRLSALNLSFPQTSEIKWNFRRHTKFSDRAGAVTAEQMFKDKALSEYGAKSLGREFFIMNLDKAESLFSRLSPATGLSLKL